MKTCTICKQAKEYIKFHKDIQKKSGLRSQCKDCIVNYQRQRKIENPEHVKKLQRNNDLKRYYGITSEEYHKYEKKQENCCAICNKKLERLFVDHNHITKQIRGLLCFNCNTGLGQFKDNIVFLKSAIKYLGN